MNVIHTVSSLPGMGKTEGAVRLMAKHLLADADGVVIYVAPTVMLLKKVEERLKVQMRALGGTPRHEANILTYNSLPGEGNEEPARGVVYRILEDLSGSARAGGNLLMRARNNAVAFVTHSAFFLMPFEFPNKERISVVFDEARKCVFEPTDVTLTERELELFDTYMQDVSQRESEYRQVTFKPKKLRDLEKLMIDLKSNRSMRVFEINRFLDMVKALKRGTTEVYYLKKKSSKKYKDPETGEMKHRTSLKFYEVHVPANVFFGWKKVVLMSAFLEQTQLYALLCRGVFKTNSGVFKMAKADDGVWKAVPARRNTAHDVELCDVTERIIKNYQQRYAKVTECQ